MQPNGSTHGKALEMENNTAAAQKIVPTSNGGRPKQNGQVRPEPMSRTGLVWDFADQIMAERKAAGEKHPVPTIGEVKAKYEFVEGAQMATCQTQYGRWVIFHDLRDALKARRDDEKSAMTEEETAAKKAKEEAKAKKAAEKEAKAKEKAESAAKKAEEQKTKAEAKAKAASEKIEAAKAKAEEAAKKAADKAKEAQDKAKAAAEAAAAKAKQAQDEAKAKADEAAAKAKAAAAAAAAKKQQAQTGAAA